MTSCVTIFTQKNLTKLIFYLKISKNSYDIQTHMNYLIFIQEYKKNGRSPTELKSSRMAERIKLGKLKIYIISGGKGFQRYLMKI